MGLGKTLQALYVAKRNPQTLPCVVVTEASIKTNWQRECEKHMGVEAAVLSGRKPGNTSLTSLRSCPFVVINYDVLPGWVDFLKKLKPGMVILDECHNLTNRQANRTKAAAKLVRGVPHLLALSGTPARNCPAELWPVLNMLHPKKYSSFWSYAERFCQVKMTPFGWEAKGAANLDQLHEQLTRDVMVRRRKLDVLEDLPPKDRHVKVFPNTLQQQYLNLQDDYRDWAAKAFRTSDRQMHTVMRGKQAKLKQMAVQGKLDGVLEWVDHLLDTTDEKIVLFGIHKKVMTKLRRRYARQGVQIVGSTDAKLRDRYIDKFQTDPRCRVLSGNIRCIGTGIDLTAARRGVFVEMSFVPNEHTQAEDRIWRLGQEYPTEIYYTVCSHTIEERLCKINQDKQAVVSTIVDGHKSRNRLNTHKLLQQAILNNESGEW